MKMQDFVLQYLVLLVLVGEEIPIVDMCLDLEQGLCETAERLLMIIHEFCSIYLESEHVHESYSCTVSSAAQLLCDLHETMEKREKEEVAQFVLHNASILVVLSLAVSNHRKCKLHLHWLFALSPTINIYNRI